jgi:hypothetical protein
MSAKTRWPVVILSLILLLGVGLSANAGPHSLNQPYLWPDTIISDFDIPEAFPEVVYNFKHNEYFVVWQTAAVTEADTIRGARISPTGQVLANFEINGHPTKDGSKPAAAYDPVHDRYLVVFAFDVSGNDTNTDLLGRFIPWEGPDPALKSFPIASWPTYQLAPDVAYGRAMEEFVVVWMNQYAAGSPPRYISGRRVRAADGGFTGSGSDMTISHPTRYRHNPAVTYNLARNEYLVVYDDESDIFGTRFTGDLTHNFGGEFTIAGWPDMEEKADVAACDKLNKYLVTWQSDQGSANLGIFGRFISGDGTLGDVRIIDDTTGQEREAAVTCNDAGNQYLVAWQTEYTILKYGIWARFVNPDGKMAPALADSFAVQEPFNQEHRTRPAVAGGKTSYLAVWEHERGSTLWDIQGRLISPYTVFTPAVYSPGQ